ncbi:helix-turn-helix transcriptional regulator [Streptomyces sp. NPDC006552]|uniref:helix-turn-helix transcriptional regulator n=1 Tax=Streptomyces sp. NPDC006552 TaxID=3157179 RepID=UPI0033BB7CC0
MGRPEAPISPSAPPPLRRFAEGLRALRREAGLNYRAMGQAAGVSSTALSQAASGHRLPTEAVVTAYVSACDGNTREWLQQRRAVELRLQEAASPVPPPVSAPPSAPVVREGGAALRRSRRTWERNLSTAGERARSVRHRTWCRTLAGALRDVGYERAGGSALASGQVLSGLTMVGEPFVSRQLLALNVPLTVCEGLCAELGAVLADLAGARGAAGPAELAGKPDEGREEPFLYEAVAVAHVGRRPELELVALPGEFIRELRRALTVSGKSFRQLSKASHIPSSTISDLIRPTKSLSGDVRLPSLDLVTRLLKACGVTPLEMTYYEQALRRVQKVEIELSDRQGRPPAPKAPAISRARFGGRFFSQRAGLLMLGLSTLGLVSSLYMLVRTK